MAIDTATGKEAPAEISSERVKDIFSTIAKKYERFNAVSSFGAYKTWLVGMMKQAPISANDDVLDIAGGTGDVSFTVARAKHPRHIQCTDLVNEMLDVARAHYADGAADGVPVDFEVVDAQEIPYADASYDAITMAYGIRNMPDRPRALSEMYRVLKPGGSLVCLEFSTPPNAVWRALYNFYLKHLIPFWGGLITGDRDGFVYLSKSIKAFPNQQGLARMMEDAGFTDVTWKNYTGGIAAVHVAKGPEWRSTIPSSWKRFRAIPNDSEQSGVILGNPRRFGTFWDDCNPQHLKARLPARCRLRSSQALHHDGVQ